MATDTEKRQANWERLKDLVHLCGPDAELRITLHPLGPDSDGPCDDTVVILKCRAGFIRAGNFIFAWPDMPSGGKSGRLQPNVWQLEPGDCECTFVGNCLTDADETGARPDIPEEVLAALEQAGFHWEQWAAPD